MQQGERRETYKKTGEIVMQINCEVLILKTLFGTLNQEKIIISFVFSNKQMTQFEHLQIAGFTS